MLVEQYGPCRGVAQNATRVSNTRYPKAISIPARRKGEDLWRAIPRNSEGGV